MIHRVDTSFLVAVELVSHARHGDSRRLRTGSSKGASSLLSFLRFLPSSSTL